jgi:hypothetical protein
MGSSGMKNCLSQYNQLLPKALEVAIPSQGTVPLFGTYLNVAYAFFPVTLYES